MTKFSQIVRIMIVLCALLGGAAAYADAPPEEVALTRQIREALIAPDETLADAMVAVDPEIPARLAAAVNVLSLGSDPALFEETSDLYLAAVQQVRRETPLLNLTAEQIEERVQFHELDRTGFAVMSINDRPDPASDLADLDPAVDILVVVVNYWGMRIGTLPDNALYSLNISLHPVFFNSKLPELSASRSCHLGAFGVPPYSVAVYMIPPEN